MTEIRIEEVTPDRWRVWRDLRLRSLCEDPDAFGSTYEREVDLDEGTWRSRLDGTTGPAALAYVGGVPVGTGAGWLPGPGRLMIVAMWTDPAWRGRGVGVRMLRYVLAWADRRGLRAELWVADSNPAARRLYERQGFRSDGRSEPLREGSPITKTHLVLATRGEQ